MSKLTSLLIALLLVVTMAPASFARQKTTSNGVYIKSASVETDRQRVIGSVNVCNTENETVRFLLDVKNTTINRLYKRRLTVPANKCKTYKLRFNKNFAEMSNTGDEIVFASKHNLGLVSSSPYDISKPYTTVVEEGNNDPVHCGDSAGEDGIYTACAYDFINHEPTGLRIKVKSIGNEYSEILVTHIRWGGIKQFRLYKDRSKEITSGDEAHTKVELTNLVGESRGQFLLEIES